MALVSAVVVALAAILAAHAVLVLARAELQAARIHRDLYLMEEARSRVVDAWTSRAAVDSGGLADSVPIGSVVVVDSIALHGGVAASLSARRLSAHLWWLTAAGAAREMREDVGQVVRQVVADTVFRNLGPAVEVDGVGGTLPLPTGAGGAACPVADSASVRPEAGPPTEPRVIFGPAFTEGWATMLPPIPDSTGALGVPAAPCGEGWNWYDPLDPGCPPGAVARHGAGSVRISGGQGAAVLLVDGDLELSGTTLYGFVVVAGALRLVDGSKLVGLARVGGGVVVEGGSTVSGSACWARAALVLSEVTRPHRLPGRVLIRPSDTP